MPLIIFPKRKYILSFFLAIITIIKLYMYIDSLNKIDLGYDIKSLISDGELEIL